MSSDFDIFFLTSTPSFPDAKCAQTDPDLFFPETPKEMRQVLPTLQKICFSCVHRVECLNYAVEQSIEYGVWGGMTPAERRQIATPKRRKYRRSDEIGEQIDRLRRSGYRFSEIAATLNKSVDACQKAHIRWKQRQGVA